MVLAVGASSVCPPVGCIRQLSNSQLESGYLKLDRGSLDLFADRRQAISFMADMREAAFLLT